MLDSRINQSKDFIFVAFFVGSPIVTILDYDDKIKVVKADTNGNFSLDEINIINSYNLNQ